MYKHDNSQSPAESKNCGPTIREILVSLIAFRSHDLLSPPTQREEERRRQMEREKERYRLQLWAFIAKKEVPKVHIRIT